MKARQGATKTQQLPLRSFRRHPTRVPESGVKIAFLDLDRFQSVNLAQDVIGQIL